MTLDDVVRRIAVGHVINKVRAERGLSCKEASGLAGKSSWGPASWSGGGAVNAETLDRLLAAFDLTHEWLDERVDEWLEGRDGVDVLRQYGQPSAFRTFGPELRKYAPRPEAPDSTIAECIARLKEVAAKQGLAVTVAFEAAS